MHVPFLDRCLSRALSISYLVTTYAQGVHAYPQTNLKSPNSNASLALSSPNLLRSRFSSLTLTYGELSSDRMCHALPFCTKNRVTRHSEREHNPPRTRAPVSSHNSEYCLEEIVLIPETCVGFTSADIALAFIAVMAQQALEPFEDRLSYFDYTDAETPVRIILRSAPHAPTAMTVRCNVMWALQQLPFDLFHSPSIWGLDFKVQLSGVDLYLGKLSNKNRRSGAALEGGGTQGGNASLAFSEQKQKRARWITQPSNTTARTVTIPGPSQANNRYDIRFELTGLPLPDVSIFSTILLFLFSLGAQGPYQAIESAYLDHDGSPVWIYVLYSAEPGSMQRLQVYQVVAILQAIARYCVRLRIYQELIFNLLVDDGLVATGCVVRGSAGREW